MSELNLEVGQKVWSIQLGDCEVSIINNDNGFPIMLKSEDGRICCYLNSLKYNEEDVCQSIFESNPFEPKLVQENKDGWIEAKENKADLINALRLIYKDCFDSDIKIIAKDKLQKLLETL